MREGTKAAPQGAEAAAKTPKRRKPRRRLLRRSTRPAARARRSPCPDIGDFKEVEVIEVLVKPGDSGGEGAVAHHARVGQGDDGDSVARRRRGEGDQGQGRRQGLEGRGDPGARIAAKRRAPSRPRSTRRPRRSRRRCGAGARAAPPAAAAARRCRASRARKRGAKPHASPSVRKFARELGVDLGAACRASGPKGRILHADVQAFVKGALSGVAPAPRQAAGGAACRSTCRRGRKSTSPSSARWRPKPLSRIQKLSGPYLHRNWISIPHVTQFDEADITDLEAFRKAQTAETEKQGFKLTMLAFMIKACVTALQAVPAIQLLARQVGREHHHQEVLPHRRRGRHAGRPGRARWCATPTARACSTSRTSSPRSPSWRATAS